MNKEWYDDKKYIELSRDAGESIKTYSNDPSVKVFWDEESFNSMFTNQKDYQKLVKLGIEYRRLAIEKEEDELSEFELGRRLHYYGAHHTRKWPGFVKFTHP
jgi:hypothetical protein